MPRMQQYYIQDNKPASSSAKDLLDGKALAPVSLRWMMYGDFQKKIGERMKNMAKDLFY